MNAVDATAHFQRGRSCEMAADYESARAAYAEALRLNPELFTARLQLAAVLERLRQPEAALVQYKRALSDAQRQGHWLDESTTPPLARALVQHAVRTVRRGHHELFDRLFAPLRNRYGRDSLDRIERCIRIYLNEESAVYPDSRQKPTFLYLPGLPTTAYFDCGQLPWVPQFEAQTPRILAELMRLLETDSGSERVFPTDQLEEQNLRAYLEAPPSWNGYYFYRWGVRREDNCTSCPDTARAIDALPLCRIRQHGPEVLFSVFTAGTHLLPHRGVTNTRCVGHLALIVPPDCGLQVGGEIYEWQPGKVVVFDDTFEHEAWNHSPSTRVVLIFDTWNPFMTEAERAAWTDLVAAIGDLRSATETD